MTRSLAVPLTLLALARPAAAADHAWLRALPGEGRTEDCTGLAADSHGGAWFLGALPESGAVTVDGITAERLGAQDVLLVHVTSGGKADRARVIGGTGRDDPVELAVGPEDAVYVLARFGADARIDRAVFPVTGDSETGLLRFDPDARCAWATEMPGTGEDGAQAVAVDPRNGTAVVVGTFVRPWAHGDVPEIYAARYGRDGEREWLRRCEGTGRAVSVGVDGAGRVYVGAASPAREPGPGRRAADGWPLVLCFDAGGAALWRWEPEREPGDPDDAWGRVVAVAAEPDGGCRVLGEVRGLVRVGGDVDPSLRGRDVFLARLDAEGGLRWLERFGGPGDDGALDLAAGPDTTCVVTGTFQHTAMLEPWTLEAAGSAAGFVAAWDVNGSCLWADVLDGPGTGDAEALPFEVSVASDGSTLVAGRWRDALHLGGLSLEGAPDAVFLARIPPGAAP